MDYMETIMKYKYIASGLRQEKAISKNRASSVIDSCRDICFKLMTVENGEDCSFLHNNK